MKAARTKSDDTRLAERARAAGPLDSGEARAGFGPHDHLSDAQQGSDLGAPLAKLEAGCSLRNDAAHRHAGRGLWLAHGPYRMAFVAMVWGYTLVSFFVASAIKIGTYRLLDYRALKHDRHLARIEGHVAA
jgi:hypothetical protein